MTFRSNGSYKHVNSRHLVKINLEDHIDYWEEARASKRHHFLSTMDIDVANIMNWLTNNAKYLYDSADFDSVKDMYFEMCDALLAVRFVFTYEIIGKIIDFIITDDRFYIKPFDFPKFIKETHESYENLIAFWDTVVLKKFPFPYKSLLVIRYEIQSFLLYLSLEGCAQNIVFPTIHFSLTNILKSVLNCLEYPMSLYFDSFHIRKLLFQISKRKVSAFSLNCVHPVVSQLHYVFQLYYKTTREAWATIEELKHIPLTLIGFSYLIQNFLIDNYNRMVSWKSDDFTENLEDIVKPLILSMFSYHMPLEVVDRLLVQGFYDIIELDCNYNLVRMQFNLCGKEINLWKQLIQAWNDRCAYEEFIIVTDTNMFLQNLMSGLYYRSIDDFDHALLCMDLIHSFISERVKDYDHAAVLLKYLSETHWVSDSTLHNQIQDWFQMVLDEGIDLGFEELDLHNENNSESSNVFVVDVGP